MNGSPPQLLFQPMEAGTFWIVALFLAIVLQSVSVRVLKNYASNGDTTGKFLYKLYAGGLWASLASVSMAAFGSSKDIPINVAKVLPQPEILGWIILFWTIPLFLAAFDMFWEVMTLKPQPPLSRAKHDVIVLDEE
jgi:hypothetical protein